MKTKLLLLLLFMLSNFYVSAQQTIVKADNNYLTIGTKWYYSYALMSPDVHYYTIEAVSKTIYEGKECIVLRKEFHSADDKQAYSDGNEYIYEEDNKLYRYIKDDFYLLYDFDTNLNDILKIKIYKEGVIDDFLETKVTGISVITVNDIELKKFEIEPVYSNDPIIYSIGWLFGGEVIERIGGLNYFFPYNSLDCDAGCPEGLRCYQDNAVFYKRVSYDCDELQFYSNIQTANPLNKELIKVSFDELTQKLNIQSALENKLILSIFDMSGNQVIKKEYEL